MLRCQARAAAARIWLSSPLREGMGMTQPKTGRVQKTESPRRRVIAIGKRVDGRWQVRTSLWRYLAATALSTQ